MLIRFSVFKFDMSRICSRYYRLLQWVYHGRTSFVTPASISFASCIFDFQWFCPYFIDFSSFEIESWILIYLFDYSFTVERSFLSCLRVLRQSGVVYFRATRQVDISSPSLILCHLVTKKKFAVGQHSYVWWGLECWIHQQFFFSWMDTHTQYSAIFFSAPVLFRQVFHGV